MSTLKDMKIVFSGFTDSDLETEIENQGGYVRKSVSSITNVLIIKDKSIQDTSKVYEAHMYNIPIMTLNEFITKFNISLKPKPPVNSPQKVQRPSTLNPRSRRVSETSTLQKLLLNEDTNIDEGYRYFYCPVETHKLRNMTLVDIEQHINKIQEQNNLPVIKLQQNDIIKFTRGYDSTEPYTYRYINVNKKGKRSLIEPIGLERNRVRIPPEISTKMNNAIGVFKSIGTNVAEIPIGKDELLLKRVFSDHPDSILLNDAEFLYNVEDHTLQVQYNGTVKTYRVGHGSNNKLSTPGINAARIEYDFGLRKEAVTIFTDVKMYTKPYTISYSIDGKENTLFNYPNYDELIKRILPSKHWKVNDIDNIGTMLLTGPKDEVDNLVQNIHNLRFSVV